MTQIQNQPEVQALWEKLEGLQLDDNHAVFDFSARLARENGWTHDFTRRVLHEYKRYLLLSRHAGHPVTPSEEVDQAWHLHLVYTRSYWDKLCRDILGRPLHHEPTAGGPLEEAKYRQQYQNTLDSYARLFGEPAPADIWPPVEQRFQPVRSRWVDVSRHWLLPKPAWVNKVKPRQLQKVALGLLGLSVMVSCQPLLNVFDLKGTEFLQFYLMGFGVACLLSWFLVWIARGSAGRISELPSDPYDIAFIGGGGDRVVDAALASLYGKKLIKVDESGISTDVSVQAPPDLPEIEAKLLVYANATTKRYALFKAMHPQLSRMQERLAAQGWVLSAAALRWHRWLAALPLVLLMLVGIIKVFVGLSRDRPVGFLVALLIGSAVFLLFRVSHVSRLTSLGKEAWASLKGKVAASGAVTSPGNMSAADPATVAMLVALGGYTVLNSGGYAPLHAALYRPVSTSDSSSSGGDSGCSSSSSCSSSSCGSSGCGGCGGGD